MAPTTKWIGSPNRTKGRQGLRPEAVVIHVMEGTLAGTDSWFNDVAASVSAHYGIGKNGDVHQYVGETDTAWHAGRRSNPTWKLIKPNINPNLYTIGIEHEGDETSDWPDAMYAASADLVRDICTRWSIPIDRDHIVGHREIYAVKSCPGRVADLGRLVTLAGAGSLRIENYNFVKRSGRVTLRVDVNVRKGAPTTGARVVRKAAAGTELAYLGWTSNGLSVNGNAHWYKDADGNYFWAGGTDKPVPGI